MPVPLIPGGIPAECERGHSWRKPRTYWLSWMTCLCAGGDGHFRIRCGTEGCSSVWYQPAHEPGAEVKGYTQPVTSV